VYRNVKTTRKEVSMEPPQCNGGLLGLQKREYLARMNTRLMRRLGADMIFKTKDNVPSEAVRNLL
jgi:hypothetical protein